MSPCCGRPNNRTRKGKQNYYERYAYLNSHQRAQQLAQSGSQCKPCAALTIGDPCSVCGNPKTQQEAAE